MRLINGGVLCGPISFTGGSMDETFHSLLAGRLQDIQSAAAIYLDIMSRGDVRLGDGDERGQMKNHAAILERPGGAKRIGEITHHHFQVFLDLLGE